VTEPARTNPSPTAADAIEDEVQEALAICGGDAIAALRITLIANAFLEAEIDRLSAAVSSGFARGKVRKALTSNELRRKRRTDDVQPAEELHGHYLLPFIRTEDGTAPGEEQECQSEGTAIRRAEEMSRDPANAGASHSSVVQAIRTSPSQSSAVVFAANRQ
jgi:hypothetical protein